MPEGTGERTGNLFDIVSSEVGLLDSSGDVTSNVSYSTSDYIVITESFSLSLTAVFTLSIRLLRVGYYDVNKGNISVENTTGFKDGHKEFTFTPPNGTMYIRFSYISREGYEDTNIMLNTGSEALPYEPYGIKIPISSADTTTPVYLGEVQTTRKIKKLVLTGEESWNVQAAKGGNRFVLLIQNAITSDTSQVNSICSHFPLLEVGGTYTKNLGYTIINSSIYLRYDPMETTTDFKSYLAAQYAAGTPVIVWYVLATEETAVVNEPLMKIGEYADSMSRVQTGIDIPTVIGLNTLDVLTTVKPSSIQVLMKTNLDQRE